MMKYIIQILAVLLIGTQSVMATLVAVLEMEGENSDAITFSEKSYLTDELRKQAVRILPPENFTIMTRENASAILDGKDISECEGSCAVETGKNLKADYVVNSHVGYFDEYFTLTVQLYNVKNNKLLGSITAHRYEIAELVDDIEESAADLFEKIMDDSGHKGKSTIGISNVKMTKTNVTGLMKKRYLVDFSSEPVGVEVSVDQNEYNCITPCAAELYEGRHQFHFEKDLYKAKDTSFSVLSRMEKLVELEGNYGVLSFEPQMGEYGSADEVSIKVDGELVKSKNVKVATGKHVVEFSHRCYEKKMVKINVGMDERIVASKLKPAKGTFIVSNSDNRYVSLFVNDEEVALLPYKGTVDVCSKIAIGNKENVIDVAIKENGTTTYEHITSFIDERDGQKYSYVQIGSQIWMAENLNYGGNLDKNSKMGKKYMNLQGVCPTGWHLPSVAEYEKLDDYVGVYASKKLRSKGSWYVNPFYRGEDLYGFSVESESTTYGFWTNEGSECKIGFMSSGVSCLKKTQPLDDLDSAYVRCIRDGSVSNPLPAEENRNNAFFLTAYIGSASIEADPIGTDYYEYADIGLQAGFLWGRYVQSSLGIGGGVRMDGGYLSLSSRVGLISKDQWFAGGVLLDKTFGHDLFYGVYIYGFLVDMSFSTNGKESKIIVSIPFDVLISLK